jgi:hypothetical protein
MPLGLLPRFKCNPYHNVFRSSHPHTSESRIDTVLWYVFVVQLLRTLPYSLVSWSTLESSIWFYVPETHIMYFIRRCWFLKCSEEIHYVPIGDGDMWYYVPVDDGWEEVLLSKCQILNCIVQNRTRAPLIECGRSTIELWNLHIIWV